MDTAVWGPPLWRILQNVAWQLPSQGHADFVELAHALATILPCKYCRQSYAAFIECFPPSTELLHRQDDMALRWVWFIHDLVNRKLQASPLAYSKLLKRLYTSAENLTANDILLTLAFFGQNYSNNTETDMAYQLLIFCRSLGQLFAGHKSKPFCQMGEAILNLVGMHVVASQTVFMDFVNEIGNNTPTTCGKQHFDAWQLAALAVTSTCVDSLEAIEFPAQVTVSNLIDLCFAKADIQCQINERVAKVEREWRDRKHKPCISNCMVPLQRADGDARGLVSCILKHTTE